jgi:hypothetical protein
MVRLSFIHIHIKTEYGEDFANLIDSFYSDENLFIDEEESYYESEYDQDLQNHERKIDEHEKWGKNKQSQNNDLIEIAESFIHPFPAKPKINTLNTITNKPTALMEGAIPKDTPQKSNVVDYSEHNISVFEADHKQLKRIGYKVMEKNHQEVMLKINNERKRKRNCIN